MNTEPEWLAPYIDRKAAQFMTAVDASAQEEWCGPGGTLLGAVEELVRGVVGEVAAHLAVGRHGDVDPIDEARESWGAGS